MNPLDLVILALVAVAAAGGWRIGFVARVTSWVGLALGLVLAVLLLGPLLGALADAEAATLLLVSAGVIFVGTFGGQALGFALSARIGRPQGRARTADRFAGAVAGLGGTVALVWLLVPVVADTPGWPAETAPQSAIARAVHDHLPPPPDAVRVLGGLIGDDVPRVFDDLRPTPDLGPPPPETGIPPEVGQDVAASVVKVEGVACGQVQDGSGVVVGPGEVVTNAHVVAGEAATEVVAVDGRRLAATVVSFDPGRDLAVLSVPELGAPALELVDAPDAQQGGVFGFPGGGELRVAPFRVERTITAVGRDIYDGARTERQVLELAADLAPGDSGAALIDPAGDVVGIAFAIAPDRPTVAYALTDDEVRAVLAERAASAISTGPCLS